MRFRGAVVAYNGADAGLGNRVRLTLGAARYAELRRFEYFYVWPTTSAFEPKITDIWDWTYGRRIPRLASRGMARLTGYFNSDLLGADQRRIVQIRTGGELALPPGAGSWQSKLRELTPVPEIADLIKRFFRDHLAGEPYVGVQIRVHRVSHHQTRATSPLAWFVDQMRAILDERPGTRFYVSCDVNEVKKQILRDFPTARAIVDSSPYNSRPAVRAAVADLYLLASSAHILGPHYSSFVELAEHLAELKVASVKPTERAVRPIDWWRASTVVDPLRPSIRREIPNVLW